MKFEAPKFDERHNPNISYDTNNAREFKVLFGYLAVTLVVLWLLAEGLIWSAPRLISLEFERRWFATSVGEILVENENAYQDTKMQALAEELARHMGLPEKSINVYISPTSAPNAYATFGGNILFYQGLLDDLEHEESVAAVLAHEIAHIKHRDPLRGMSRYLFYSLFAAAFGSDSHLQLLANVEGMRYGRTLERAADEAAVHALARHYGSVGGAETLFNALAAIERKNTSGTASDKDSNLSFTWLSTHPETAERITYVREIAAEYGYSMTAPRLSNHWRNQRTLSETPRMKNH